MTLSVCMTLEVLLISPTPSVVSRQTAGPIQRSIWRLNATMDCNLDNLRVDGRLFQRLTGRSPVG
jgi:hypothetical protein